MAFYVPRPLERFETRSRTPDPAREEANNPNVMDRVERIRTTRPEADVRTDLLEQNGPQSGKHITVILGDAGDGTTSLALEWARQAILTEQAGANIAKDLEQVLHKHIKAQGYVNATPNATGSDGWLEAIRAGVDSLVIVTHGDAKRGLLVQPANGSDTHAIPFAALGAAILEGAQKRPLCFLCVFACDTTRPLLDLLERLALQSCLHPHFDALIAWGQPDTRECQNFLQGFFTRNFEAKKPDETTFLDAVRQGRRQARSSLREIGRAHV